jgi:hypothetical protein
MKYSRKVMVREVLAMQLLRNTYLCGVLYCPNYFSPHLAFRGHLYNNLPTKSEWLVVFLGKFHCIAWELVCGSGLNPRAFLEC